MFSPGAEGVLPSDAVAGTCPVCGSIEASVYREGTDLELSHYNLGGGRTNSVSILEAIERCQGLTGKVLAVEYVETSRLGDHITYISGLRRLRADYPQWKITRSLDDIFRELTDR